MSTARELKREGPWTKREEALQRHWAREREIFKLKNWQMPPCCAVAEKQPIGNTLWTQSYAVARKRRLEFLAADEHHYDDLE
jgi:hypothetical protein